jgi:hypothetical protein
MPVHIEQMTSRVDVKGDAPPMTEHQIERLVTLVLERLEATKRDQAQTRASNEIRDSALPPGPGGVW